jgi:hypothetical protein
MCLDEIIVLKMLIKIINQVIKDLFIMGVEDTNPIVTTLGSSQSAPTPINITTTLHSVFKTIIIRRKLTLSRFLPDQ